MKLSLKEIAKAIGGELVGDANITITGISGIKEARGGDITFLANPKYARLLDTTKASAVITSAFTVFASWSISPRRRAAAVLVSTSSAPSLKDFFATFQAIDLSLSTPNISPFFPFNKLQVIFNVFANLL